MEALKFSRAVTLIPLFMSWFIIGCDDDDDTDSPIGQIRIEDTFEQGANGWSSGFADYDVGEEELFELQFERTALPDPLDADQMALKLSGTNRSDELFMFLKKKVSGLEPDADYQIDFSIEFASNVADNLVGIGGSPGESVFVKVGAAMVEPEKVSVTEGGREFYRMNVDKGGQSKGGDNAVVVGDFSNDTDESVYTLKTVETDSPFEATTDENGVLWLLVGTDSGFEGTTTIYYNQISATLSLADESMSNNQIGPLDYG